MNGLLTIFFCLVLSLISYSQTDLEKWNKAEISYQLPVEKEERNFSLSIDDPADIIIKPMLNVYWFFISDVDGKNCPFYPSCSEFFAESVKTTNFLQGTLMFFDRFTRDLNFYNRNAHYKIIRKGRYYDPAELYTLDEKDMHLIPSTIFNNE
jgi:putative component of membrane protein insertase Oxa1/YidC/SpoIIIJ protein YidD